MMLKKTITTFFLGLFFVFSAIAQNTPVGVWKTIDDETGNAKSHVEIYQKDGKLYGKVIKLLADASTSVCTECPGDKKGKSIVGMEILWDLEPYDDYWSYGQILDPKTGKTYKCNLSMNADDKDILDVRGYIGFSLMGRSQNWYRITP